MLKEEIKPFKCYLFDYSCPQRGSMNKHVASVHERKKPFKCEICDYSSSQNGSMNGQVESVHEGKKTFKCNICYMQHLWNTKVKSTHIRLSHTLLER